MGAKGRTRNRALRLGLAWLLAVLGSCAHTPDVRRDDRPGDFTLGVVVTGDREDLGAARYIVDADQTFSASFGDGSSLGTDPRFTRTLDQDQLDVLWSAAIPILESDAHDMLHPGQPQEQAEYAPGSLIVEVRLRGVQRVVVLEPDDQRGAALVDILESLAWVDR